MRQEEEERTHCFYTARLKSPETHWLDGQPLERGVGGPPSVHSGGFTHFEDDRAHSHRVHCRLYLNERSSNSGVTRQVRDAAG